MCDSSEQPNWRSSVDIRISLASANLRGHPEVGTWYIGSPMNNSLILPLYVGTKGMNLQCSFKLYERLAV